MYRSNFLSLPSTEPGIEGDRSATSGHGEETADTPLDSATALLPTREASIRRRAAPKKLGYPTSSTLRISSVILHSLLVAIHLTLVGIWVRGLEHRVIVGLENQKLASFLITATATAFGTIYSALLVFVTQRLSMRRSLQLDQVLTATHDNAAAWAGLGAAISHLWNQRVIPARGSLLGVLSAALYLAIIHIIAPPPLSLRKPICVPSIQYAYAPLESQQEMEVYAPGSLYFLPSIVDSTTNLGLTEGTLYDVLDSTVPSGNATVDATGFNISCGSLPNMTTLGFVPEAGYWMSAVDYQIEIYSTPSPVFNHSIVLYSTIPIVDSNGNNGSWVDLSPPMNTSVSSIQVFQCSLSLVSQTAVVNSQTRQVHTVQPDFKKTTSTWVPYNGPLDWILDIDSTATGNLFIDTWGIWYSSIPLSDFQLEYLGPAQFASVADLYLIQKLNLPAANQNDTPSVTLHDVENGLSAIVASMFWTLGHIPPTHRAFTKLLPYGFNRNNGTLSSILLADIPQSPILLPGNANLNETYVEVRLEVSAGLSASIALMFLSLLFQRGSKDDQILPIDGTGILHVIWLYRNHPELEILLDQVENPTDDNLRAAGMVRTRLSQIKSSGGVEPPALPKLLNSLFINSIHKRLCGGAMGTGAGVGISAGGVALMSPRGRASMDSGISMRALMSPGGGISISGMALWLAPAQNGLFRAGAWIWVGSPAHARPIGLQATLMAWQAIPPT
ncbi:hypothetical protein C8R44DRAFT_942960 [Mycena epipterygia]|nr:hypothetical protein C8R44DRAFT_942960 [Mycena epipterygia]